MKSNHKNFVQLLVYIHILRWCTLHTTSNYFWQITGCLLKKKYSTLIIHFVTRTAMYTRRHFRENVATVEEQWVYICSHNYPAHTANAPYNIVICVLSGSTIFSTLSLTQNKFWENVFEHKVIFWYSLQLLSAAFLSLRRSERNIVNVHRSSCKVPAILVKF